MSIYQFRKRVADVTACRFLVSRIMSSPPNLGATTTYSVDQIVNYVMTIYIILLSFFIIRNQISS